MPMPLTSRPTTLSTMIQCVTRTSAIWRGTRIVSIAASTRASLIIIHPLEVSVIIGQKKNPSKVFPGVPELDLITYDYMKYTRRDFIKSNAALAAGFSASAQTSSLETFSDWIKAARKGGLGQCLQRIRNLEPSIHAWVVVQPGAGCRRRTAGGDSVQSKRHCRDQGHGNRIRLAALQGPCR